MFRSRYGDVFKGDKHWQAIKVEGGETYGWNSGSTYVQNPPYFEDMALTPAPVTDIENAKILALFLDSITTDHISPAGSFKASTPAGEYLIEHQVRPIDFNSYGSRRGNHEVMMRGTFANIRIKNQMLPGVEGGYTKGPDGQQMPIYDAAMAYKARNVPLVVFAGKEYGTGSSRDWAAKGTNLLGVKAVVAESFERIHRSNLVGMGVLPLQFKDGENARTLGLDGSEEISITGLQDGAGKVATIVARKADGSEIRFEAKVLLLTPKEVEYFRNGGILHYVLRQLAARRG
jgi:aconitate hydratase